MEKVKNVGSKRPYFPSKRRLYETEWSYNGEKVHPELLIASLKSSPGIAVRWKTSRLSLCGPSFALSDQIFRLCGALSTKREIFR